MINRRLARSLIFMRRYYRSVRDLFKVMNRTIISHWKIISVSSVSAIFLISLSYIIDSTPYPIGGEVIVGQWMERFNKVLNRDKDNIPDSICLVNVAYDKTLVDYEARIFFSELDSPSLPVGKITTTDRQKMLKFLSIADSLKNYRYILLDVRFENDIESDSISKELFSLIGHMDNIVFAVHENTGIADSVPMAKAAYGDYHTTFLVTDVVKYPLLKKSNLDVGYRPSIPAKMYSDLHNQDYKTIGLFTFCNNQLCTRSIYPTFPIRLSSWAKQTDESQLPILQYYNLGEDLINMPDNGKVVSAIIENRIVVVGDFIDDIHDTYVGPQPGALINLNAYISLCKNEHIVHFWGVFSQFMIYVFITWFIIRQKSFIDLFPYLMKPSFSFLRFVMSFIGYSFILTLVACLIYVAFGSIFSIALPSLYFTILQSCVEKK